MSFPDSQMGTDKDGQFQGCTLGVLFLFESNVCITRLGFGVSHLRESLSDWFHILTGCPLCGPLTVTFHFH